MKEENNLQGKTSRLLYFMSELEKGHKVNKTEYLKRFNIAERTFKDDLRELKENLKSLCTLTVPVRVYPEIVASVKVSIEKE